MSVSSVKISDLEFILDEKGVWDDNTAPRDVLNLPAEKRKTDGHWKRIENANMSYPILIGPEGWIIDGIHRFCKAVVKGDTTIKAYKFTKELMQSAIIK